MVGLSLADSRNLRDSLSFSSILLRYRADRVSSLADALQQAAAATPAMVNGRRSYALPALADVDEPDSREALPPIAKKPDAVDESPLAQRAPASPEADAPDESIADVIGRLAGPDGKAFADSRSSPSLSAVSLAASLSERSPDSKPESQPGQSESYSYQ